MTVATRPASHSTWVCFSWPRAPQLCRSHVCVFGLIHFFAAAALPSSRPPEPNFHISSLICGSSQHVNSLFRGQLCFFFPLWFLLFNVLIHCRSRYLLVHSVASMLNNNIVESYNASDSAAADVSCCLCACRAPSGAPLFAGFICRKNNVRNALACQRRRYHSITAAVLPRLPLFSWFKVWNMTPVQSTDWTITWFWTLKSSLILSHLLWL